MASVIGGIEGGATHSTIVLVSTDGKILAQCDGPGTNHFLLGIEECAKRLYEMVNKAKLEAGLPSDTKLKALGLALSGCEEPSSNLRFASDIHNKYPDLSERIIVGSDTDGSLATISNTGGVVCIAGTGSNTLLVNPDGSKAQCGGYGFKLGDEGSAWKVVHSAVKYCLNDIDGFESSPHPTEKVWSLIKEHYSINNHLDLLEPMYNKFDKPFMAQLCKKFAVTANQGDPLSKLLFEEAGRDLAKGIAAVYRKADKKLTGREGGLHILCVGSVWFSWNLLMMGFIKHIEQIPEIKELSLMKLTTQVALGSAYMACERIGLTMEKDYSKNYEVFFKYKKQCVC